jgi:hypothetical protein
MLTDHKRDTIKYSAIRFDLFGKTSQRISVALQFKTVQLAIDHCEIDPRCAVLNAQLLKNDGFRIALVFKEQRFFRSNAYVGIIHNRKLFIIQATLPRIEGLFAIGHPSPGQPK